MDDAADRCSPLGRCLVFLAIAGALFGIKYLILMNGGAVYGRLAIPPPYDDVTYFVQALTRLKLFQQSDLWAVIRSFWAQPPHAPYSEIGAFLGFLIGGVTPERAYAVNAVATTLIAASVATAFRWSISFAAVFFAFMTSLHWFDQVITIFHPDLVSGFAVAAACTILLWQDQLITSRWRAVLAGLMVGLALLIKPTVLPYAVAMIGLSFVLGAVVGRRTEGGWSGVLRRLAVGVPTVLLIAGPYYVLTFRDLLWYIHAALVTQRDVWAYQGTRTDHFLYFLLRVKETFGYWPVVAAALVTAKIFDDAVMRRWAEVSRWSALIALIFLAYLVPTLPAVKTYLFGGVLYGMLVVTLGVVAAEVAKALPRLQVGQNTFALGRAIPAALLVATFVQFSDSQMRVGPQNSVQSMLVYEQVFAVVKAQSQTLLDVGKPRPVFIYTPTPVPVSTHAFLFRGLRDGVDVDAAYSVHDTNVAALYEIASRADVVMLPDAAIVAESPAYPVKPLLAQFSEWIAANPRFNKVAEVRWGPGQVLIYRATLP
jgi:hypothetical protein